LSKPRKPLSDEDLQLRVIAPLAFVFLLSGVLVGSDAALFGCAISRKLGQDSYRILLQFLLITGAGGLLLALLALYRARLEKRAERVAAIQSLDRELDEAYRTLKGVKRKLRAFRIDHESGRLQFRKADFREAMKDLLEGQLKLEVIGQHISGRTDLFDSELLKRIGEKLHYAERYYANVYEAFENGEVTLKGAIYTVPDDVLVIRDLMQRPGLVKMPKRLASQALEDLDFVTESLREEARRQARS